MTTEPKQASQQGVLENNHVQPLISVEFIPFGQRSKDATCSSTSKLKKDIKIKSLCYDSHISGIKLYRTNSQFDREQTSSDSLLRNNNVPGRQHITSQSKFFLEDTINSSQCQTINGNIELRQLALRSDDALQIYSENAINRDKYKQFKTEHQTVNYQQELYCQGQEALNAMVALQGFREWVISESQQNQALQCCINSEDTLQNSNESKFYNDQVNINYLGEIHNPTSFNEILFESERSSCSDGCRTLRQLDRSCLSNIDQYKKSSFTQNDLEIQDEYLKKQKEINSLYSTLLRDVSTTGSTNENECVNEQLSSPIQVQQGTTSYVSGIFDDQNLSQKYLVRQGRYRASLNDFLTANGKMLSQQQVQANGANASKNQGNKFSQVIQLLQKSRIQSNSCLSEQRNTVYQASDPRRPVINKSNKRQPPQESLFPQTQIKADNNVNSLSVEWKSSISGSFTENMYSPEYVMNLLYVPDVPLQKSENRVVHLPNKHCNLTEQLIQQFQDLTQLGEWQCSVQQCDTLTSTCQVNSAQLLDQTIQEIDTSKKQELNNQSILVSIDWPEKLL